MERGAAYSSGGLCHMGRKAESWWLPATTPLGTLLGLGLLPQALVTGMGKRGIGKWGGGQRFAKVLVMGNKTSVNTD